MAQDIGPQRLTYCLNVHPTETWDQVHAALTGPMLHVKREISPDSPFAAGLRLSAQSASELLEANRLQSLKTTLADCDYRAATVNGFPYGTFHGKPVKRTVYEPDWRSEARLDYTCALADIMVAVAPPGQTVSISTVPGCFRSAPVTETEIARIADHLMQAAAHCAARSRHAGCIVAIALEPEPSCLLETMAEVAAFFEAHIYSDRALKRFAGLAGLSLNEAETALPRHLGICYDVCHAAVLYEEAADSLETVAKAGVRVHKLQLSAALKVPAVTPAARESLVPFDEPVYLHQVYCRGQDGTVSGYEDLSDALRRGHQADGEEWRIHFHVPIFLDDLGEFETTQDFLIDILTLHRQSPICDCLEVETYTWDAAPASMRAGSLEDAIARELRWVQDRVSR